MLFATIVPTWALSLLVAAIAWVLARGMISSGMFREGAGLVGLFLGVGSIAGAALCGFLCAFISLAILPAIAAGLFVFGVTLLLRG